MLHIVLTTEFAIDKRLEENRELISYLDNITDEYCKIYRFVWSLWVNKEKLKEYTENEPNKLKSIICHQFGIKARVANSIIQSVKGRYTALKELKKHELTELKVKITSLEGKINKLKIEIEKQKPDMGTLAPNDEKLVKYKKTKHQLHQRQGKLNRLNQKRENLEKDIKSGIFSLCFGSSNFYKKQYNLESNNYKTHKKWLNDFRRKRNNQISYLGESTSSGNQLVKLSDVQGGYSLLQVTNHLTNNKTRYSGLVKLNYLDDELKEQIIHNQTTSYRFIKRKGRWSVQAFVTIELKEEYRESCSDEGVIGLDFNVGYITLSEIDKKGNLVYQKNYYYNPYRTHNQNKDSIRNVAVDIVNYALEVHKDIIIEELDFKKKKASIVKSSSSRSYNRMLSHLAYAQYKDAIHCRAIKSNIYVREVKPYNTSKIAKHKYCKTKKLNTHQGASYVIARRGAGFKEV